MRTGYKLLIAAGVAVAVGGLVTVNLRQARSAAGEAVEVRVLQVDPRDLTVRVLAPATLEAGAEREVRAAVSATAARLRVAAGDRVQAGQVLAELAAGEWQTRADQQRSALEAARSQLVQLERQAAVGPAVAQERLESARLDLQAAEAGWVRTEEGLAVQRRSARERVDRARAQLDAATTALSAAGAGQGDLDAAARQVEEAQAALASAQADLAETDPARSQDLAEARLRVESARSALRQAELDISASAVLPEELAAARQQVAAAEQALAEALADLAAALVRAPAGGTVLAVGIKDGQPVQAGQVLFVIGDTDRLTARARVDEVDVSRVAPGQEVAITAVAFPGEQFRGSVTRVEPQGRQAAEGTATVYTVEIRVDAAGDRLRPGMNVDAEIAVATQAGALSVPLEAVRDQDGEKSVWVIDSDGLVRRRTVTTGLATRNEVEITSGLAAGDRIVPGPVRVLRELRDGQPVRPEPESAGGAAT